MPQLVRWFFQRLLDQQREAVMTYYLARMRTGQRAQARTRFGRKVDARVAQLALRFKQKWAERLRAQANGSR